MPLTCSAVTCICHILTGAGGHERGGFVPLQHVDVALAWRQRLCSCAHVELAALFVLAQVFPEGFSRPSTGHGDQMYCVRISIPPSRGWGGSASLCLTDLVTLPNMFNFRSYSEIKKLGCGSMVELLPAMHEVLGPSPALKKKKKIKRKEIVD